MQRLSVLSVPPRSRQRGFSLMEVLVALLVLSIGLLGLAGLQTLGLKFNSQSYQRTQAVLNAYDIIDRIRANPIGMGAGTYDNINLSYTPPGQDCMSGTCSTTQMADYDIGQWKTSLGSLLTQGQGGICRGTLTVSPSWSCTLDTTTTQFMVGITYVENDLPMTVMVEAQL